MSEVTQLVPKDQKILSLQEMLDADDIRYDVVEVWGGNVRVASLDAGSMLEFTQTDDKKEKQRIGLKLIISSLVDAAGTRIGSLELIDAFAKKGAKEINKLLESVLRLNGTTKNLGIDMVLPLKLAGKDERKLRALTAELRRLASKIEAAGTDQEKLDQVLDEPQVEAKNG